MTASTGKRANGPVAGERERQERDWAIVSYLRSYWERAGTGPLLSEIAGAVGMTSIQGDSYLARILGRLEREGKAERVGGAASRKWRAVD